MTLLPSFARSYLGLQSTDTQETETRSRGTDCLPSQRTMTNVLCFPCPRLSSWCSELAPRPSAVLVAREERLAEDIPFHLELIQAVLDHVTDADDPAESPLVHDRDVPSPVTRHPAHHRRDAVFRRARDDR